MALAVDILVFFFFLVALVIFVDSLFEPQFFYALLSKVEPPPAVPRAETLLC